MENGFYIKSSAGAGRELAGHLRSLIKNDLSLVILCIGTMRVRGDSLGPLVGSRLYRLKLPGVHVYGTEDMPVHALNLEETLNMISRKHPGTPVLAVDAATGKWNMLGRITFGAEPLHPGAGLEKALPPAGDAHITGVLGLSGPLSFFSLRLTPRRIVQMLVREISEGIQLAFAETIKKELKL